MAIWVHIAASVSPDGDEAKTALTSTLKTTLTSMLVNLTSEALPPDKFTTKPEDKPKGKPASFNAIKISPALKLKLEIM